MPFTINKKQYYRSENLKYDDLKKYMRRDNLFETSILDELKRELRIELYPEEKILANIFTKNLLMLAAKIKQNGPNDVKDIERQNLIQSIIVLIQYNFLMIDLKIIFNKKSKLPIYFLNMYCGFLGNQFHALLQWLIENVYYWEANLTNYRQICFSPFLIAVNYHALNPYEILNTAIKHEYECFWTSYHRFLENLCHKKKLVLINDIESSINKMTFDQILTTANPFAVYPALLTKMALRESQKIEWNGKKYQLAMLFDELSNKLNISRIDAFEIAANIYKMNGESFTAKSLKNSYDQAAKNNITHY